MLKRWRERRRKQKYCFHHDIGGNPANTRPAISYISQEIVDLGRHKLFECEEQLGGCGKHWVV